MRTVGLKVKAQKPAEQKADKKAQKPAEQKADKKD